MSIASAILPAVVCLVVALILERCVATYFYNKKYKLPPRVPGLPILGNSLQIPLVHPGTWAKEMADKYGEMFTCKFGESTWVFLNSSRVVTDLLERRAAIYCSRPRFPMTQEIISRNSRVVLMPYSDRWREVRKIMHQILSTRSQNVFMPFQDLESRHLLHDYLHNPEKWFIANGRFANSVIMSVVFGTRSMLDDPHMINLFRTVELFLDNVQPGACIANSFPILARLPSFLQWWRPLGNRIYEETKRVYQYQLEQVDRRVRAGTQKDCFAKDFLESKEASTFDENQILFLMGTLMEAGSDTTRLTLGQIVAGAATYPDWVKRAREQLDAVCGNNGERLPEWSDRPNLPYITAVVKEGFRWRPNIAEIGLATSLIKDDEYEGYRFPAGTVFTWNAWALALNPKEYEQPERFWPDRFLNDDLNNALKGHWGFGTGRRVCVGWNVGEMNVWIAVARLIYCFDFIEDQSNPIDTMRIPSLNSNKAPFSVKIKVRSPAHAALIDRDCSEAVNTRY